MGNFTLHCRKAKVSETLGEQIVHELVALNILKVEVSREFPLRRHPKHKLKKEQRSYRVQDKLRFVQPFMRFWFGFVTYYRKDLASWERAMRFWRTLGSIMSVCVLWCMSSSVMHCLCNTMHNESSLDSGSYWNIHSEFDILAVNKDKKIILGECKYKDRKVCKNELSKLKVKAEQSGINVDVYALFSKSGFSNELLQTQTDDLLLFDLNDLKLLAT